MATDSGTGWRVKDVGDMVRKWNEQENQRIIAENQRIGAEKALEEAREESEHEAARKQAAFGRKLKNWGIGAPFREGRMSTVEDVEDAPRTAYVPPMQTIQPIAKAAALVAVAAFLGALTLTTFPTTLDEWKHVFVPAFAAVVLAERMYFQKQEPAIRAALLAELRTMSPELSSALSLVLQNLLPPPPETTTTTTATPATAETPAAVTTTTTTTPTVPVSASIPPATT